MNSPLKVYVAGASAERAERAIPVIKALRVEGISITHDWTREMEKFGPLDNGDASVSELDARSASELDINGVRQADFVLLLAPNQKGSAGSWIEYGAALAYGIPVIIAGREAKRSIFATKAFRCVESDKDGIEAILELQRKRA